MDLFANYIHPLTNWLQANPTWALFFTFIVALAESLAIVGSIIPGSVTMTAIGILAGSGILRIDLTLIASSLGAICGDSLSYLLGYFYSDRLTEMWPFKKYPSWLIYGKDFFERHGGKSVLIGRFVGPLRSIIPVIAGIMHMKQWRFLVANVISAIGWSLLYIMPGVFIGAAGHELSAESATRFFIVILLVLVAIWLIGLLLKWTLIKLHLFFKNNLHDFWCTFKSKPILTKIYTLFTPNNESNHYTTAGGVLLTFFSIVISMSLILVTTKKDILNAVNLPVHLFLQSCHTSLLEMFFICCTQLTSTLTIGLIYASCCIWFLYNKKLHTLVYLSALIIGTSLLGFILNHFIDSPRPLGLSITMQGNSFPDTNLLVASALYGFIFYYVNNKYLLLTNSLRSFMMIILALSGIGSLYLGDYWLTDVLAAYFIGATACLITCMLYRTHPLYDANKSQSAFVLVLLIFALMSATITSTFLNFKTLVYAHTQYQKIYTIEQDTWWNQNKPILPLYHLNRLGNPASLLNIEYLGNIDSLQSKLEAHGWEVHNESFFKKLLMYFNNNENELKLPLFTQLYENKGPELVMAYKDTKNLTTLQLILWQSNYSLRGETYPLWIGTLYPIQKNAYNKNILSSITPVLDTFSLKQIALPNSLLKKTIYPAEPYILLIKNTKDNN